MNKITPPTKKIQPAVKQPVDQTTVNQEPLAVEGVANTPVTVKTPIAAEPTVSWEETGLRPELLDLVRKAGYPAPTPVQGKAIPKVLSGTDLVVSAQTGTGKTAAFALPMIEKLIGRQGTYGIVLAPTREIALQTQKVLTDFGAPLGIVSVPLIGGTEVKTDEKALRDYPQVIVATPGRLCDHLERGNVWLEYIEMLVLDEADRMLEMGFASQLNRIVDGTPPSRQTLLFSATMSTNIQKLAKAILYQPDRIEIGKSSTAAPTVEQKFYAMEEDQKLRALQHLLREERGTIFVFTRSKQRAASLWRILRNKGFHEATQLHSDLSQANREEALHDFKSGKYRVMIATDVMGRGIHVDAVAHVVNFDMPREGTDYIHRIGRTGRAEKTGKSTSFVTARDTPVVREIEKLIGKRIHPQR